MWLWSLWGHPNENFYKIRLKNKEDNMKISYKLKERDEKTALILYAYFSNHQYFLSQMLQSALLGPVFLKTLTFMCCNLIQNHFPYSYADCVCSPLKSLSCSLSQWYHISFPLSLHDFWSSPLPFMYLPSTSISEITIRCI